jgi:hypothetical protein
MMLRCYPLSSPLIMAPSRLISSSTMRPTSTPKHGRHSRCSFHACALVVFISCTSGRGPIALGVGGWTKTKERPSTIDRP